MAGRTIKGATVEPGAVLVVFDDQSNMKIKASWTSNDTASGKVKSVQETKAEFKIGFEDGSSAKAALERRQSA